MNDVDELMALMRCLECRNGLMTLAEAFAYHSCNFASIGPCTESDEGSVWELAALGKIDFAEYDELRGRILTAFAPRAKGRARRIVAQARELPRCRSSSRPPNGLLKSILEDVNLLNIKVDICNKSTSSQHKRYSSTRVANDTSLQLKHRY